MNTPSPFSETRRARLLVALVIATAAAAVTAGVALKDQHVGEPFVRQAEASPAMADGAPEAVAPGHARRGQWRDPWRRPGRLSESAPASIHEPTGVETTLMDLSLPSATEALKGDSRLMADPIPAF